MCTALSHYFASSIKEYKLPFEIFVFYPYFSGLFLSASRVVVVAPRDFAHGSHAVGFLRGQWRPTGTPLFVSVILPLTSAILTLTRFPAPRSCAVCPIDYLILQLHGLCPDGHFDARHTLTLTRAHLHGQI